MVYTRDSKKFVKHFGSRAEVLHGNAYETTGRLRKNQLKRNKRGGIVSKKASTTARKINRLERLGFKTHKGTFSVF